MIVFAPRFMRQVPTREACSAMTREGESIVGGLGAGGIIEMRLEDLSAISGREDRASSLPVNN